MRAYIFMDLLRRGLKLSGYKPKTVMNITDVGHLLSDADEGEDKMAVTAREQKKTPKEIADYYTKVFLGDCESLNIGRPEIIAKATDYIKEMIEYVEALVNKGYGYETDDGIYFDISKFHSYGKLSRLNLDAQQAGARVDINTQKRNPHDFALWKKAEKNHIMQWQSPWGMGYPGWHIECSAMGRKFFGKQLDIHTGGVDHIPVHHENEIAQSEAREDCKTVNYWLHGAFMLVDGGKMSKSCGTAYTLKDLKYKGYSPLAFRYFCLNAHYKKELNFTFSGMDSAATALARLYARVLEHKASTAKTDAKKLDKFKNDFAAAIKDDLNVPAALGNMWTMLKEPVSVDIYNLVLEFDAVFGLDLKNANAVKKEKSSIIEDLPKEIKELLDLRAVARLNKDFAESDRLRDLIATKGFVVKDTKDGQTVTKL